MEREELLMDGEEGVGGGRRGRRCRWTGREELLVDGEGGVEP